MFTGYNSDDPDAFSIVLLTDVVSGTVIYITDRGWSNTTGFRVDNTGEGTISLTFNQNYPCGTSIVFSDVGGSNDWEARDANQNLIGTVAIDPTGDPDGIEFNAVGFPPADGDQLFIYQSPEPTAGNQSSFVTGIHMNGGAWNGGNGDDYSSQKPDGLGHDEVVRFNTEYDNAKYNCSIQYEQADNLRAAITNVTTGTGLIPDADNRWQESNTYINLFPTCDFCCAAIPLPVLSYPAQVAPNQVFTVTITGTLPPGEMWELRLGSCNTGTPLTTTGNTFTLTAPATEQTLNYFLQNSGETSCPDDCIPFSICVESNPLALCTNCTANPNTCGDCFLPPPADNPDLDSGCFEVKLLFILDESGSIGSSEPDVRAGVLAFLGALNGQDIQCALIEFSSEARLVNNYTIIDNAYIQNITNYFDNIPYNGQTYVPNGGTNWHDAMIEADALLSPDLVLFFTDGVATFWTQANNVPSDCGNGATTQTPEIVNPVKLANKLKSEGTHMFMLGVGTGIDVPNLEAMSGFTEYESGVNTIGTADYSIGAFEDLAEDLVNFVNELCQTPLVLTKELAGPSCDSSVQFRFVIYNPGTQSAATVVNLIDTLPPGFANPVRIYPTGPFVKFCVGGGCEGFGPPPAGPQPPNTFIWVTNSLPPGARDTLIVEVDILPSGSTTNIAWAKGFNTNLASDTVVNPVINDDLSPLIFCPPDISVQCDEPTLPANTGEATASDNATFPVDIVYADVTSAGTCPDEYSIERTWTATDVCNNSVQCVQLIEVVDTEPPVVDCPPDVTLVCGEDTSPAENGLATAEDACAGERVPVFTDVPVPGPCVEELVIQRIWTATDLCGNTGSCVQLLTIIDNVDPVMTCPADVTIDCTESTIPASTGLATGSDNCTAEVIVSHDDDILPGACPQAYTITRTWTVADECGNNVSCAQIIVVTDEIPPDLACPADVTIDCSVSTAPSQTGSSVADDLCDPAPGVTYADSLLPGGCPQAFTLHRTWTAVDDCGNSSTCLQTIVVQDTDAPELSMPGNVTIDCSESTMPAHTGNATATDNCGPLDSLFHADTILAGSCLYTFTLERTWTAVDLCGLETSSVQVIQVQDVSPPVVTCPVNLTLECTESTVPDSTGLATATDNCDAAPEVIYGDITVAGDCPHEWTVTRTWTATDTCGNSATCVQTLTIIDSTAPSITCPADITITCLEDTSPDSTGVATATDNCDATPGVGFADNVLNPPGDPGYVIERTWTATDTCGNSSTCLQVITVTNPLDPEEMPYDTICSGESVVFEAADPGYPGMTFDWSFGSGASPASAASAGPHSVTYAYNVSNGTFGAWVLLTLEATGCEAVTDTVTNIHVNVVPTAGIVTTAGTTCVFGTKTFQPSTPEVPGYSYLWNFGAGAVPATASTYGPHSVEYSSSGSKTVQLIIQSNEAGASCGDTATTTFTVSICPGNVAGLVTLTDGTPLNGVLHQLFADSNLDGQPDNSTVVKTGLSTAMGTFLMTSVTPGYYVIKQTQPGAYFSVLDEDTSEDFDSLANLNPNDNIIPVTVEPNEVDANNRFWEAASPGIISGYVFDDADNNQQPGASEGIAGAAVQLFADTNQDGEPDSGTPLQSTTSNTIGYYTFGNLTTGDFVVMETQPSGFNNIKDIDVSADGDVVANTNMTDDKIPVTINAAEHDAGNYFIEQSPCSRIVTTLSDGDPGSLRYMIECAESGDTITFNSALAGDTVHINMGRIQFDKTLYIRSDLNPTVVVKSNVNGMFKILGGHEVGFRNLVIISGLSLPQGAAFENLGELTLYDVIVRPNALLVPLENLIFNAPSAMLIFQGDSEVTKD